MRWGLLFVAFLAITSAVNANITGWNCGPDTDGGISMTSSNWQQLPDEGLISAYELTMDAIQNNDVAHMQGDFITNNELDPIVWIMEDVDNNTGFTWTGYEFYVYMNKTFTINAAMGPAGWDYDITQPVGGQTLPHNLGTGWMGLVTFSQNTGNAIPDPGMGSFGVKIAFAGTVSFCTEQIPTPEPATMALLGLGALGLIRRK